MKRFEKSIGLMRALENYIVEDVDAAAPLFDFLEGHRQSYNRRETISAEGMPWAQLSRVESGFVHAFVRELADGRELLVRRFGPGDLLFTWDELGNPMRYVAASSVQLVSLSGKQLDNLARAYVDVRVALLQLEAGADRALRQVMARLTEPVAIRVALYLVERTGEDAITRDEIAAAAGTIVRVSDRILMVLRDEGAIGYVYGRVLWRSESRLHAFVAKRRQVRRGSRKRC
ncbi:MAG: hypothetical protein NVSMB5_18910 [Candidatus Velthaea sp.]